MSVYMIAANGIVTRLEDAIDMEDTQRKTINSRAQKLAQGHKNKTLRRLAQQEVINQWVKEMTN